jgi:hypothetical protein
VRPPFHILAAIREFEQIPIGERTRRRRSSAGGSHQRQEDAHRKAPRLFGRKWREQEALIGKRATTLLSLVLAMGCTVTTQQSPEAQRAAQRRSELNAKRLASQEERETREKLWTMTPIVREAIREGDCSKVSTAQAVISMVDSLPDQSSDFLFTDDRADAKRLIETCQRMKPASGLAVFGRMTEKRDDIDHRIFYTHKAFSCLERGADSKLEVYIGQVFGEAPYLRLRARYGGGDWIFAQAFTIASATHRYDFAARFDRDHYTDVWETADIPVDGKVMAAVRSLIKNGGTVRFRGRKGYMDYVLTPVDRAALRDVLQAFAQLGRSSPPFPASR